MTVLFKIIVIVFAPSAIVLCCAMWKAHRRARAASEE